MIQYLNGQGRYINLLQVVAIVCEQSDACHDLRRMTFSTRGSHFVKWVWLRYIAKVLLTLRHNTFKHHSMTIDDIWRHASRDKIVQAFSLRKYSHA